MPHSLLFIINFSVMLFGNEQSPLDSTQLKAEQRSLSLDHAGKTNVEVCVQKGLTHSGRLRPEFPRVLLSSLHYLEDQHV